MINIKNNKGITLLSLTIYIIAILIVIGIMVTIRSFFYNNLYVVKDSARYAAQFDKFNSYFVQDIKVSKEANLTTDETTGNKYIILEDGTTYVYNYSDKSIYRNNVKVATNVELFFPNKKTIIINNTKKDIINIELIIGNSAKTLFHKKIDYTLKYW